ncbi:hypothetical protein P7L53_14235 [Thermoleptolyngbya sichuanensis XZ-Cy5]|nr:hypothetical protein [Thermoleptolyngbya sichuanensis]MDG2617399.1 hypothetical protein [Thermoleptolyngbya sichuanensis XZ-Cy5]
MGNADFDEGDRRNMADGRRARGDSRRDAAPDVSAGFQRKDKRFSPESSAALPSDSFFSERRRSPPKDEFAAPNQTVA